MTPAEPHDQSPFLLRCLLDKEPASTTEFNLEIRLRVDNEERGAMTTFQILCLGVSEDNSRHMRYLCRTRADIQSQEALITSMQSICNARYYSISPSSSWTGIL